LGCFTYFGRGPVRRRRIVDATWGRLWVGLDRTSICSKQALSGMQTRGKRREIWGGPEKRWGGFQRPQDVEHRKSRAENINSRKDKPTMYVC